MPKFQCRHADCCQGVKALTLRQQKTWAEVEGSRWSRIGRLDTPYFFYCELHHLAVFPGDTRRPYGRPASSACASLSKTIDGGVMKLVNGGEIGLTEELPEREREPEPLCTPRGRKRKVDKSLVVPASSRPAPLPNGCPPWWFQCRHFIKGDKIYVFREYGVGVGNSREDGDRILEGSPDIPPNV